MKNKNENNQEANVQKSGIPTWLKLAVLGAIALALILYFVYEPFKSFIDESFGVLKNLDVDSVVAYIRGYGTQAAIISFTLMVLSSVVAPIPAFLITLSNAAIFGWWKGALLSWSSAMVGAALCFFISRVLGRDVALKFMGNESIKNIDGFLTKYGVFAILVFRLLPFVSFDLISYAAGLTGMSFLGFFLATGVGQAPATIVYSYVGSQLTGGAKALFQGLLVLFAVTIIIAVGKKIFDERNKKMEAKENKIDKFEDDNTPKDGPSISEINQEEDLVTVIDEEEAELYDIDQDPKVDKKL